VTSPPHASHVPSPAAPSQLPIGDDLVEAHEAEGGCSCALSIHCIGARGGALIDELTKGAGVRYPDPGRSHNPSTCWGVAAAPSVLPCILQYQYLIQHPHSAGKPPQGC
jgi:hypothetical protein